MNTRAIVIFLAINGIISVAVGYKLFNKNDNQTSQAPVTVQQAVLVNTETAVPVEKKNEVNPTDLSNELKSALPIPLIGANAPISLVIQEPIKVDTSSQPQETPSPVAKNDVVESICTVVGPMDFSAKNSMEVILKNDSNFSTLRYVSEEKPVYEVYWNLGKDRELAENLLQKQKESGTMSDSRYMMVQSEAADWIVPIIEINSSIDVARDTANTLAQTANKQNAGGKWQYRTKPTAYFYTIKNFEALDKKSSKSIDMMINAPKYPCADRKI